MHASSPIQRVRGEAPLPLCVAVLPKHTVGATDQPLALHIPAKLRHILCACLPQETLDTLRVAMRNTRIMCAVMLDTKVSTAAGLLSLWLAA